MTLDDWLRTRPFLAPVARVRARIDAAIAAAAPPCLTPPAWDDYRDDFLAGVPLLHSTSVAIDLHAAGRAIVSAVAALGSDTPHAPLTQDARALDAWLRRDDAAPHRAVDWLLGDDGWSPPHAGLLRSVGWLTVTASLAALVADFAVWRALDDERPWMRRYCPTCGSSPAMGQLVGVDPGRRRLLCCGCCASRWQYGRMLCPFCETESHRAASVTVEGEHGLRIDYCESCRAYVKTYAGQGAESVLLADWTSIHLDLAARERGWRRAAVSLYEIETPAPLSITP